MILPSAKIQISASDSIEQLAKKLQAKLDLPAFRLESDMDPPHTILALTECLGFELSLQQVVKGEFQLCVDASLVGDDLSTTVDTEMSDWLAKYIGIVTGLTCVPLAKKTIA